MDKETRDILNIIKAAVTKKEVEISNEIPLNSLFDVAKKHSIFTLFYYGLYNCNVSLDGDLKERLLNIVMGEIRVSEQQLYYIKKISTQFNENNIDFMLLKGSVLKHFYPKPEIRRMGDIDILIKETQYSKISNVLVNLGFAFQYESNHEIVWRKNNIVIELHKILMPSFNKDLHGYFGNGWKRAILKNKSEYMFSDDDMFIHLFSHFAKHYRDAGIGIIHMCDLYVYLKNIEINKDYVFGELKKLQLYDFYCNIKQTLEVWFEDSEPSEMTDYITKVIFNSGVYGLRENAVISSALKEKKKIDNIVLGRIHRIWTKIFPAYRSMKTKYQILKKYPVLLPVFWVIRLSDFIFCRRKEISKNLNDICVVNEQQIQEYETALNHVGLDYNFK